MRKMGLSLPKEHILQDVLGTIWGPIFLGTDPFICHRPPFWPLARHLNFWRGGTTVGGGALLGPTHSKTAFGSRGPFGDRALTGGFAGPHVYSDLKPLLIMLAW